MLLFFSVYLMFGYCFLCENHYVKTYILLTFPLVENVLKKTSNHRVKQFFNFVINIKYVQEILKTVE